MIVYTREITTFVLDNDADGAVERLLDEKLKSLIKEIEEKYPHNVAIKCKEDY